MAWNDQMTPGEAEADRLKALMDAHMQDQTTPDPDPTAALSSDDTSVDPSATTTADLPIQGTNDAKDLSMTPDTASLRRGVAAPVSNISESNPDATQAFGKTDPYKKQADLLQTQAETKYSQAQEMLRDSLNSQAEITPTQALATGMLALLPAVGGYLAGRVVGAPKLSPHARFTEDELMRTPGGTTGAMEGAQVGTNASQQFLNSLQQAQLYSNKNKQAQATVLTKEGDTANAESNKYRLEGMNQDSITARELAKPPADNAQTKVAADLKAAMQDTETQPIVASVFAGRDVKPEDIQKVISKYPLAFGTSAANISRGENAAQNRNMRTDIGASTLWGQGSPFKPLDPTYPQRAQNGDMSAYVDPKFSTPLVQSAQQASVALQNLKNYSQTLNETGSALSIAASKGDKESQQKLGAQLENSALGVSSSLNALLQIDQALNKGNAGQWKKEVFDRALPPEIATELSSTGQIATNTLLKNKDFIQGTISALERDIVGRLQIQAQFAKSSLDMDAFRDIGNNSVIAMPQEKFQAMWDTTPTTAANLNDPGFLAWRKAKRGY